MRGLQCTCPDEARQVDGFGLWLTAPRTAPPQGRPVPRSP